MNSPAISPTIRLLRVLGSPFIATSKVLVAGDEVTKLYNYAVKNRLPLYYLETLKSQGKLGKLKPQYEVETRKHQDVISRTSDICRLFRLNRIECIVFKTIRPYPVVPNDVDVILRDSKDYLRATTLISKEGYQEEAVRAPEGTHLHPSDSGVFFDLRTEIAVSHLIYLDKSKLVKYLTKTRIDGEEVIIFCPEVELAITVAHSLINEQAYTLQDYYLILFYLAKLDSDGVKRFLDIVKENHITRATSCHFAITAILHEAAHGVIPDSIKHVLWGLGDEKYEAERLIRNNLKVPHKFRVMTVVKAVLEKMREGKARRSIALQIVHLLNPSFARSVWYELHKTRTRETW